MTTTTTKEVPWVDAAIRYTHLQPNNNDTTVVDDDEEDDLPPTESHTFIYPNPNNLDDDGCDNDIKVEIKGFHDDSEQTWNSTGLTLWRSSHYLCQYLLSEEYKTLQKDNHIRVLELGSGLGRKVRVCIVLSYAFVCSIYCLGDLAASNELHSPLYDCPCKLRHVLTEVTITSPSSS